MTPPAPTFLPYGKQSIDESDIEAVVAVLREPLITQGPMVDAFEEGLARFLGASHVTAVSNGTAALHLAYAALGIGPGDEIITSPVTFAATANAARYLGADVRFADVDPTTGNLLVSSVARLITPRTRAIVAVHLGGLPCDMDALRHLCDEHGLYLVEDAAHALGATYRGKRVGSGIADVSTFSFHPVKHITTGEGGAIATESAELDARMRRLRHHGIERCSEQFQCKSHGPWYYEVQELGYNYRLTDLQSALGLSQLSKQEGWLERRRQIASRYREQLHTALEGFTAPQRCIDDRQSAYHLFPVLIDFPSLGTTRTEVMESLRSQGVGTQVHYIPVNWQPYYQEQYGQPFAFEGVHRYYEQTLSLPMYPGLSDDDVDYIVAALSRALQRGMPAKVAQ